jgi:hypothetical protein
LCPNLNQGPVALTYNVSTQKWEGTWNGSPTEFYCIPGGSGWRFDIDGTVVYDNSAICAPFYFERTDVYFGTFCEEGNGNIYISE